MNILAYTLIRFQTLGLKVRSAMENAFGYRFTWPMAF